LEKSPLHVVCSTVRRGATNYELSGRIIEVVLPSGEVTLSMNIPDKGFVSGPRGGTRGGRGVRVSNNRIYVATHNCILVYNFDWKLVNEIWHPHAAGFHEIQVDREGIWCCSTLVDAIFKLDFRGQALFQWWASEDEGFVSWLGARKLAWDKTVDYAAYTLPEEGEVHPNKQFHINTVHQARGKVYGYDSNHQALFQFWPKFAPLIRNPSWNHAHNVYPRRRDILVNNSALKTFEIWRIPSAWERFWHRRRDSYLKKKVVIVEGEGESTQFSTSGWIRGRIDLGRNEFIVGSNPASLHHVKEGKLFQSWFLSNDVNEAIHGLALKHESRLN
jgi:hypothetical protein